MKRNKTKRKKIYLASPYTHPVKHIVNERVEAAREYVSRHTPEMNIFSPIVYSDCLLLGDTGTDWKTWWKYNKREIDACDELHVLMLPGWEHSEGVRIEIEYANENNILTIYKRK